MVAEEAVEEWPRWLVQRRLGLGAGGPEFGADVVAEEAEEEDTAEELVWPKKPPAMEVRPDLVPAIAGADAAAGKGRWGHDSFGAGENLPTVVAAAAAVLRWGRVAGGGGCRSAGFRRCRRRCGVFFYYSGTLK